LGRDGQAPGFPAPGDEPGVQHHPFQDWWTGRPRPHDHGPGTRCQVGNRQNTGTVVKRRVKPHGARLSMTTVFIISAPSGSGRSPLVARLLRNVPGLLFSVSYTTRRPRGAEKPGQSYNFIEKQEFEARIAGGEFLEYAEVFGNYYGT